MNFAETAKQRGHLLLTLNSAINKVACGITIVQLRAAPKNCGQMRSIA